MTHATLLHVERTPSVRQGTGLAPVAASPTTLVTHMSAAVRSVSSTQNARTTSPVCKRSVPIPALELVVAMPSVQSEIIIPSVHATVDMKETRYLLVH